MYSVAYKSTDKVSSGLDNTLKMLCAYMLFLKFEKEVIRRDMSLHIMLSRVNSAWFDGLFRALTVLGETLTYPTINFTHL